METEATRPRDGVPAHLEARAEGARGGSSIGRYLGQGQVQNTGQTRSFSLQLDLTRMPTPTGLVAAAVVETWHFQAWHRDFGWAEASNCTDAVSITF